MALSDVLFETTERLGHYTQDRFYIQMYGGNVIAQAEQIIVLCDELRRELDAVHATELQPSSVVKESFTTENP